MQEGIHYDLTSEQAKTHFLDRASYHLERVKFYERKIALMGEPEPDDAGGVQFTRVDPRQQFEQSRLQHANSARIFLFRAEFIAPDEKFRLTEADLRALEFLERYG